MILQIDKRALPEIQEDGCYYMDILNWTNVFTNIPLDFPFINDFYERCVERKFIENNFIQEPASIFYALGFKVIYLGKLPATYICKPDEFEINHWIRWEKQDKIHHFVCGNGHGCTTYDPYGMSRTVREGELYNKRVFKRITL